MKNKTGIITGFIVGMAGFLLLFKVIILDRVSPEDELAPGIVVIASVMTGVLLGFVGYLIQSRFEGKRS